MSKRKGKPGIACPHCGNAISIAIGKGEVVAAAPAPEAKPNLAQGQPRGDAKLQQQTIERLRSCKSTTELDLILEEASRYVWRPDLLPPINEAYVQMREGFGR